jgi:hypothetical protein
MTTQLDEFSLNLPITQTPSTSIGDDYAMDPSYADQAAAVMSSPSAPETSVVIGDPSTAVDSSMVSVFANTISPVTYGQDSNGIACFDVVFSVGVTCEDGSCKTYQVVKRIGIDKSKIASDAMNTAPVSIVEAKKEVETKKPQVNESAKRARQLAGLE